MKMFFFQKSLAIPRFKEEKGRRIILFTLLFLPFCVLAQNQEISGSVFDSNGNGLIGATIKSLNVSGVGTTTDIDGNFILNVNEGTMLEVSYIGYETQNVAAKNGMKVVLLESYEALDEVVVVGYGTTKKSDLTGAVTSITSKAFIDQPASSALSILAGRAPGVSVRSSSGSPGQGATIRIRGMNSILGSNDPLIVVDGNYSGMPNAYDIESIEILKDASATAIYGSRGANGVIIVTTKRGRKGEPTVRLNTDFSVSRMTERYDLMNAYEYASYHKEQGDYPFLDDEINYFKANPEGTDWQEEILQTGISQNYKLTISGGSENVNYYISPSIYKRTGVMKNSGASGYGINTKTDLTLHERVSVQLEINASHSDNLNSQYDSAGSNTGLPLMGALSWAPTEPVYAEDGSWNTLGVGTGTMRNPLLMLEPEQTNFNNNVTAVGNMNIKLLDGLDLNAKGLMNIATGGNRIFYSEAYQTTKAEARLGSYENKTWLINTYLNYNKIFANVHNLSAMIGFEQTQNKGENLGARADLLPTESVKWYNLGLAAPSITVGSGWSNSALRSYFGRVNYNYDSRYYLTANFRSDGSSKFRPGKQFGYFPSFSAAWRLSEEQFMKDLDAFQNIKLRGGWGITGSQAVNSYETFATLNRRGYTWGTNTQYVGYYPVIGGNPDLRWESTRQLNVGLDLTFANSRVSVALDYYNKKTVDLLAPVSMPAYNGGVSQYGNKSTIANVGSVRNEGFEFNLNWDVVQTTNFSYDLNFNGAVNRNKVLDLGETPQIFGESFGGSEVSPFVLMPGHPIGTIYGLKYLGIWQVNEADEAAKFGQEPGDYKYEDLNGNFNYDPDDYQVIGNSNPKFTWGFNNHFTFKNLNVNILIEGLHDRDVINATRMQTIERTMFTAREGVTDRWSPENPNAEFAKRGPTNRFNQISSHYMEDASFVKLRNISIGYRFPRTLISFVDLQLSVSAQNLLTLTKYKGYDPEISSVRPDKTNDDANTGMDWFAYPNSPSFSFGLSITY